MLRRPSRLLSLTTLLFLAAGILLSTASTMHAQDAPSPDAAPQGPAGDPNPPEDSNPVSTLKVNVNLVSLFFDARDKHGVLVPNLTKNDCGVTEDKVPRR